eukprot:1136726-Pelagomonas_calceolata.AAC.4
MAEGSKKVPCAKMKGDQDRPPQTDTKTPNQNTGAELHPHLHTQLRVSGSPSKHSPRGRQAAAVCIACCNSHSCGTHDFTVALVEVDGALKRRQLRRQSKQAPHGWLLGGCLTPGHITTANKVDLAGGNLQCWGALCAGLDLWSGIGGMPHPGPHCGSPHWWIDDVLLRLSSGGLVMRRKSSVVGSDDLEWILVQGFEIRREKRGGYQKEQSAIDANQTNNNSIYERSIPTSWVLCS